MTNEKPVSIESHIELFADDHLIESLDRAAQKLHHPERREVAFECDMPWESHVVGFNSVVQEGELIRLYYRASTDREKGERFQNIAMAESRDGGYSFDRPIIGLIEHNGSKQNNLIAGGEMPLVPPVFKDTNPDCRDDERYKGVCAVWRKLYAMCSDDGIIWRLMQDEPIEMTGTFDTINTAFWDSTIGEYRCFTRFFEDVDIDAEEVDVLGADTTAVRSIQSSTSPDFLHWSPPVPHTYKDDYPKTQLYTNSTVPCPGAEHIYLSFPNRYVQYRIPDPDHKEPGVNDALFMCSRDCASWTRYLDAWVRPGLDPFNWTERNNYPAWGIVRSSDTEWSMYISEHYRRPGVPVRLRRLSIPPYRFVSISAAHTGGAAVTKPFAFTGTDLYLNCSTSAAGGVSVTVLSEDGRNIDGFGTDDMEPYFGDSLSARIRWRGDRKIGELVDRPIRLRFSLNDADIFAMQIR